MTRVLTDRQSFWSLIAWLTVVLAWLLFLGPQICAGIDWLANGVARHAF